YLVVSFFVAWATAGGGRPLFYIALPLLLIGVRATASNGCMVSLLAGVAAVVVACPGLWEPRQLAAGLALGPVLLGLPGVFHGQIAKVARPAFSARPREGR